MVSAVVPAQILQEDEIVLVLTKPSLWFIVFTSVRFLLTTVLLGVLVVRAGQYWAALWVAPRTVAWVAVVVCLGRLVWALLVWTSHIYMLTDRRVVTIKGVLNVDMYQANLRKIQRTTLYRPWLLRLFGMGTVGFATAATTGFDSTWVMIGRPLETHEAVVAAINKVQ
jgi:membrane protein YdbS with pleckstrin-like domain